MQISGGVRQADPRTATAIGRMPSQLPNGRNAKCAQKSHVQTFLLVVMKSFLEHTWLQDMKRFQRLDRVQVPQQRGKFNFHKNGDRNEIAPGSHIAVPTQARAPNMLVEKSRK